VPDRPAVGIVGCGRMGTAMAERLAGEGFALTVHNRSRDRAAAIAGQIGAAVADTAAAAAERSDVVVVSLADDAAVEATYAGPAGLASGLRAGQVVVETSTIDPETVRAVLPRVTDRGASLLDAPVSGSVPLVRRGELTVLAGGEPAALEQARLVLAALAARIFHLGPSGSGATMKLAVNAVVHGLNQALSEALVLAERAGVPRAAAYEVFAASAVAAPFVLYKRGAFTDPEHTPPAFSLDLVGKDLDLIAGLADRVGARVDQVRTNRRLVAEAVAAGLAGADMSALAGFLRGTAPAPADLPGQP
jgi:3-hydroxyisobutyrate dehydrogenase-like beta-hydroxyacid dehydrogenase